MKRFFIYLLLLFPVFVYSDVFDLSDAQNKAEVEARNMLKPAAELFDTGLNASVFPALDNKFISAGAQVSLVPIKKEGILTNSDMDLAPFPFFYGGLSISSLCGFVRFFPLPTDDSSSSAIYFLGFGAGYDISEFIPLPLLNVKAVVSYNGLFGAREFTANGFGISAVGSISLPFAKPYAEIGYHTSSISITDEAISIDNVTGSNFKFIVGAKLLGFLYGSYNIVEGSIGISAGLSF